MWPYISQTWSHMKLEICTFIFSSISGLGQRCFYSSFSCTYINYPPATYSDVLVLQLPSWKMVVLNHGYICILLNEYCGQTYIWHLSSFKLNKISSLHLGHLFPKDKTTLPNNAHLNRYHVSNASWQWKFQNSCIFWPFQTRNVSSHMTNILFMCVNQQFSQSWSQVYIQWQAVSNPHQSE